MEEYAKSRPLKNYPYNTRVASSHHKGNYDKKTIYCEDIITFDIETTSFFYGDDLKPFLYKPGKTPEYWSSLNAGAIPYMWQLGINDQYYYGRDLWEFYQALGDLPAGMKVKIFIFNLSFEWHFLDMLHWDFIFAKSRHKPIKASCVEFPGIEFCCAYEMIDRSLAEWGKILGLPKLEMDYNRLRTPLTKLAKNQLKYGQRDLEIMYLGIKEELKIYGSVWDLPITSTGAVRQEIKKDLMSNDSYRRYIKKTIPGNWYHYATSRKVFWGGYVNASRSYAGQTWINQSGNLGFHGDFCSHYIAQMLLNKYPCTGWNYGGKTLPDPEKDFNVKAYKLHLKFTKLRCETRNAFIPLDKVKAENAEIDINGKILKADSVVIWCTCLDYYIIRQMYTWGKDRKNEAEGVEVLETWYSYMDYLPKKLVSKLLDLFEEKARWKYVNQVEYFHAKRKLDAVYGMCATSLCQAPINWDINSEEWSYDKITVPMVEERLAKLRMWRDCRYFVSYDYGVYVAAWSRFTLLNDIIIPNDMFVMYSDTDSAFFSRDMDFTEYNKSQARKVKAVCDERGLDYSKCCVTNAKGETSHLGFFGREPDFVEFRALGPKKYCQRLKENNQLELTVSGINKDSVSSLKDDINEFKDGLIFDKDSKDVTKLLHTYFDRQPDLVFPDGYVSHQRRGVNLRPNGYKLKAQKTPQEICEDLAKGLYVSEYDKHLRGVIHDGVTD